jgi:DNA-binding transcriptional MerR regulator
LDKSPDAFRTISEVADGLDVPQHVLRFWESRFPQIRPMKRAGGRRYYRPEDVDLLRGIRHLLYGDGYTIRGVQRILREQGPKFVQAVWEPGAAQPLPADDDADEDAAFVEAAAPAIEAVTPRLTVSDGVSLTQESAEHVVGLSAEDMNKLQRALSELAVCRQLMDDVLKDEAA